jgi:hypothetical protein
MVIAVETQSIATVIVAVIGTVSTLLAGLLTHRKESAAERARWVRDRRTDVYLPLTRAYLEAQMFIDDQRAAQIEIASILHTIKVTDPRLRELKAKVDASESPADIGDLQASLEQVERDLKDLDRRHRQLDAGLADWDIKLPKHLAQLEDLLMPLQVLGSSRVRSLASDVQDELMQLLAAVTAPEPPDPQRLYEMWAQLNSAMRKDLGVSER